MAFSSQLNAKVHSDLKNQTQHLRRFFGIFSKLGNNVPTNCGCENKQLPVLDTSRPPPFQMFSFLLTGGFSHPSLPPLHPHVAPPSGISGIKAILVCRGHFQTALPALFISAASASARSVSRMKVPSADLLLSRASFSTHPKNIKGRAGEEEEGG